MQNSNSLSFDIVKKCEISKSFRSESIRGKYDIQNKIIEERFSGYIDLKNDWNIGIIYGASGTGKTTIAKDIFKDNYQKGFVYSGKSIVDDFNNNYDIDQISEILSHVGFSSPPSWLKPYYVLSDGEKMRVDIARAILSEKDLIVFDEFTSTVDREVAKIGSYAISKYIKKTNKKFIAVSCHHDIINWLEPDWTFCTDDMKTHHARGSLRRPKIQLGIYREKGRWEFFKKYHYLNYGLNNAAHQFVGRINGRMVCFIAVLHHPHAYCNNLKRVSRIVVHPDYQGIGIGTSFINYIGNFYKKQGMRLIISLSHYGFIRSLDKNSKWKLVFQGRKKAHSNLGDGNWSSSKRVIVSFEYKG